MAPARMPMPNMFTIGSFPKESMAPDAKRATDPMTITACNTAPIIITLVYISF